MPVLHVEATSGPLLQDVADFLGKSRKVVVVTGAGISTNSGIPDFRSKNGLYSLIQARFDASKDASTDSDSSDPTPSQYQEGPPAKRRRLTEVQHSITVSSDPVDAPPSPTSPTQDRQNNSQLPPTTRQPVSATSPALGPSKSSPGEPESAARSQDSVSEATADTTTSSTTPAHSSSDSATPPTVPFISSPLSSPPPVLFDPFDDSSSPCTRTASRRHSVSSTSSAASSRPDPSALFSSRSTLPNLKGKDLFDATIWADPLKTSMFYTFATELRRKTKDAEPTSSHRFISQLRDCGKLVRCYTQNIDEIEEKVGLATSLDLGPGSRGRFSLRGGHRPSVKAAEDTTTETSTPTETPPALQDKPPQDKPPEKDAKDAKTPPKRDPGVECVYLHGSLNSLRCFTCRQTSEWDEGREDKTLSGLQPRCPHCEAATAARQERGKRALGIGLLRPDIVLYGEDHPKADLISPIIQHDLALCPDMMIILGTSLRVHGLKVMVREFAKTIHNRGGKVVFVNLTKPPESVWSDIIDYWIQWDCDAWVQDLKERKPILWLPPGTILPDEKKPKKRRALERDSTGSSLSLSQEASELSLLADGKPTQPFAALKGEASTPTPKKAAGKVKKPVDKAPPKYPMAVRDCQQNGAYLVDKIMGNLAKYAGRTRPPWGASSNASPTAQPSEAQKPSRKSAPAAPIGKSDNRVDLVADGVAPPKAAKRRKSAIPAASAGTSQHPTQRPTPAAWMPSSAQTSVPMPMTSSPLPQLAPNNGDYSMVDAVKSNPRKRRRKTINGVEVALPTASLRKSSAKNRGPNVLPPIESMLGGWPLSSEDKENLIEKSLPPLRTPNSSHRSAANRPEIPRIAPIDCSKVNAWSLLPKPQPIHAESKQVPISPPPNMASPMARKLRDAFFLQDPFVNLLRQPPLCSVKRHATHKDRVELSPNWGPTDQLLSELSELPERSQRTVGTE